MPLTDPGQLLELDIGVVSGGCHEFIGGQPPFGELDADAGEPAREPTMVRGVPAAFESHPVRHSSTKPAARSNEQSPRSQGVRTYDLRAWQNAVRRCRPYIDG